VRVYERGVGETEACGSGACASMIAFRRKGTVHDQVEVDLPGGKLNVTWPGVGDVVLKGPTEHVFDGQISMQTIKTFRTKEEEHKN
jgi:diaminopimelate epimerase